MTQPTPLFIVGSGRSGTTIVATLLNLLPRVHIAKETGFIGIHQNDLLKMQTSSAAKELIPMVNSWLNQNDWQERASEDNYLKFCSETGLTGAVGLLNYVWQLDSETPWSDLQIVGDNTPLYVMAIPVILALFPNARFIHMVRDPRDVVCSILKMRFGACETTTAAMEWHHYLGCWLLSERLIPQSQRIECRYEDLCTNPGSTFERIAAFAGFDAEVAEQALKRHASRQDEARTGFERIAKWGHHRNLSEPLTPARIGRFRKELSEKQISQIENIAQYGMRAYGYELSEWPTHPLMLEDRITITKAAVKDVLFRIRQRLRRT